MKQLPKLEPGVMEPFFVDLNSRLELVRERVTAELVHLDQVDAVASTYATPLPSPLRLVR